MSKPKMLAAEQPPETEAEAAADAAAQDALVVETAAPPVPAETVQESAMAAAWAAMRGSQNHSVGADPGQTHAMPALAVGTDTGHEHSKVPPGFKLVPIDDRASIGVVPAPAFDAPEPFRSTLMRTLADQQAAADDGLTPVTVRLKPSVMQYLTERAAMFGEAPADHLARIVREFRQTDTQRPDLARLPGAEVGMPALARPR